jgi:hypothetical protein
MTAPTTAGRNLWLKIDDPPIRLIRVFAGPGRLPEGR